MSRETKKGTTGIFEVFVNGYGVSPVKLFETDDYEKASDCCGKNNSNLLISGVPGEALVLHPQYQYYRRAMTNNKK